MSFWIIFEPSLFRLIFSIVMKIFWFAVFFVFALGSASVSQNLTVKGRVLDAQTHLPLAFVNISDDGGVFGTMTDVDGFFSLRVADTVCCLKFSYVGYGQKSCKVKADHPECVIWMERAPVVLEEVEIVPGKNPADEIMQKVAEHVEENDPEHLKQFSYVSYDKMSVSPYAPELMEKHERLDSIALKTKALFDRQNFFLMESVIKRNYMRPGLNQEKVLATRVSGLKDPMVIFMLSQIQSASFYAPKINIGKQTYVNPVGKRGFSGYYFEMKDTLVNLSGDTTFVIRFRPKPEKKFNALEGVLYVNSDGWAIQNVKATTLKDTSDVVFTIEQSYRKYDSVWFPYQLKTNILFKKLDLKVGDKHYPLMAAGVSYIKDVDLAPGFKRKDFGLYAVDMEKDALEKNESFWNEYRNEPLSKKDEETYRIIDSLGKASHLDRKVRFLQSMASGKIPLGPVSLDMGRFFRYNVYEGFYLGVGAHTNHHFSERFRFGGFLGYGLKDEKFKYGMDFSLLFHKATESELTFQYYHKTLESGGVEYFSERDREWSTENFGDFFVERKNLTKGVFVDYTFRMRALRDFKWNVGFGFQHKQAYGDYVFRPLPADELPQIFHMIKWQMEFRFAFREKIVRTTRGQVSLGSDFPIVYFKYTQAFKNILQSDVNFTKLSVRLEDKLETRYYGDLIWSVNAGWLFGSAPAPELFFPRGTYRIFTLYAPNTFGTMLPNEFLSDRFLSVFLTWDFKDLLISWGSWKPRLMLLTNMGVGSLSHPEDHLNESFKTMEKGYFESGVMIRKLLDLKLVDFGLGVLYRYGAYAFPKVSDNMAYKLSIYYGF